MGKLAPAVRDPLLWQAPHVEVTAMNAVTQHPIASIMLNPDETMADDTIGIVCFDASDPYDLEAISRSLEEFLLAHPQFQPSPERPGAVELRGSVRFEETVIVPRGTHLLIAPGTDITLERGASLLLYGGLTCVGTETQRIRVHGVDGVPWGTFAVIRPEETVRIQYTDFRDGGQKQANGMLFTGGVAVHEGDLEILHTRFSDMQSEDALNIKYGHLVMRDCLVERSASDALDIDVGTGEVRDSRFLDIAGDALDVSYSEVTLKGNEIENIADKGISVGERSRPLIEDNLIKNCSIGISCKDLSQARVNRCTFVENRLAIEAKRKKPMFGGGSGTFIECVFAANDTLLREDIFSRGRVQIQDSTIDTKEIADRDLVRMTPSSNGTWFWKED
jgi:hypothetical protein